MTIEKGKTVALDYTLEVEGEVVDSSKERKPLEYVHGEGNIIPGLAEKLEGMKEGEEKTVEIAPENAYGEFNPEAFREVPKDRLPGNTEPKKGMMLQMQTPNGQAFPVTISEVKDESVVLNMNHPMAGKTLTFDVTVVSVK